MKSKINFEIIVVDNASTDNSSKILESYFNKDITLIKNRRNLGFATANNQAVEKAQGEYLIFLNSDTIISNDFISPCIDVLIKNKGLGAISPILFDMDSQRQRAAYGVFPNIIRLLTQTTKKDPVLRFENNHAVVDWISGCSFIINHSLFKKINGWDASYFLYYEDIDICKNLKAHSYNVAIHESAQIIHLAGGSPGSLNRKKQYFYQSQDYYFQKWHGKKTSCIIKALRFFYKLSTKTSIKVKEIKSK